MAEVEARAAENIAEACAATSSVRNYVLTSSLLTCFWRDTSDSSLSHVVDHNTWSDESFCKRKKVNIDVFTIRYLILFYEKCVEDNYLLEIYCSYGMLWGS